MRLSLIILIAALAYTGMYFSHLLGGHAPIPAHPIGVHTQAPHPTTITVDEGAPVQVPQRAPQGQPEGYTCTSPSSCAVLAAALNGPTAQPQAQPRQHRQPRAHSTQRGTERRTARCEDDQRCWDSRTMGNREAGVGAAHGPKRGRCESGGTYVARNEYGVAVCRY